MARLIANGVEMRAQTLMTAPGRAVAALQRETGLKLAELIERGQDGPDADTWSLKATEFLSEQARGNLLTWEQVWDRPLPTYRQDADEIVRGAEEAGEQDPPAAGTGTPADDAPALPAGPQPEAAPTPS